MSYRDRATVKPRSPAMVATDVRPEVTILLPEYALRWRPPSKLELMRHKYICRIVERQRPLSLPATSRGADHGFTHFCFCGLFFVEEDR